MARIYRLASRDGWRLLHALLLLWEVDLWLRLRGFARLQARLNPPVAAREVAEGRETTLGEARRVEQALRRAARYVPGARCLHRSLALILWLRRHGVAADLRIGVRTVGPNIEGHAWVEAQGVPLDEEGASGVYGLLEPRRAS